MTNNLSAVVGADRSQLMYCLRDLLVAGLDLATEIDPEGDLWVDLDAGIKRLGTLMAAERTGLKLAA